MQKIVVKERREGEVVTMFECSPDSFLRFEVWDSRTDGMTSFTEYNISPEQLEIQLKERMSMLEAIHDFEKMSPEDFSKKHPGNYMSRTVMGKPEVRELPDML